MLGEGEKFIPSEAEEFNAETNKGQKPEAKKNLGGRIVESLRKRVNAKVEESKFPSAGYKSTMGIYGGKLAEDEQSRLVYDVRGTWSRIDQKGDRILRSFDEHHVRNPGKMLKRHPKELLKRLPLAVDSKRYRGTPEQTMENVKRLGLEEYYGSHPWGIEIKKPEEFRKSVGLQDIYRQDQIASEKLEDVDRFQATAEAAKYMRGLHDRAGGIAEGNVYSFLFTKKEAGKVKNPIVMIPTEVYNPEKNISEGEKKATDLLDFLASVGAEEWRRSQGDWESVKKALNLVLESYEDQKVISLVQSYIKRGRLTLPGDIESLDFEKSKTFEMSRTAFSAHNRQRLGTAPEMTAQLRKVMEEACGRYIKDSKEL